MKTKMLLMPLMALLLTFAVSGCYVHRPYDPYYENRYPREYKYKHRHDRDRDYDRDRDRDRDDDHYSRNRY